MATIIRGFLVAARLKLTPHFQGLLSRLNPSPSYVQAAARAHTRVRGLIEDPAGPCADLRIHTFLQGSYRRSTAIYTINDVDVVALCSLTHRPSANQRTRDYLFACIREAIEGDSNHAGKVHEGPSSMCVKLRLKAVTVEVLPALRSEGLGADEEPFWIFRPREVPPGWGRAFARVHHAKLTDKNRVTEGAFVPIVKIIKHLRSSSRQGLEPVACSFHIECLLHKLSDTLFSGSVADSLVAVLHALSGFSPAKAAGSQLTTPAGEHLLFGDNEWDLDGYAVFHQAVLDWSRLADLAAQADTEETAIEVWRELLGVGYFPSSVSA